MITLLESISPQEKEQMDVTLWQERVVIRGE